MIEFGRVLTRKEASGYLTALGFRASVATLNKLATVGGGPVFRKAGRFPVYDRRDLDVWAQQRMSPRVRSTAEFKALEYAG